MIIRSWLVKGLEGERLEEQGKRYMYRHMRVTIEYEDLSKLTPRKHSLQKRPKKPSGQDD